VRTQRDRARFSEGERLAVAVMERDDTGFAELWSRGVRAEVAKFDLDQLAAAAAYHDLQYPRRDALGRRYREPTGTELLEWAAAVGASYETVESDGNLLTTAGLARITSLITAGGGQAWDTTRTRIGVGDTATAANVADTDLGAAAGSTHRQFQTADNSTPTTSNGVITVRATHGTSVSNFHWQEWCIDNGTANGTTVTATMMNHKITDLGTKTSAASWVFTVTVTLA